MGIFHLLVLNKANVKTFKQVKHLDNLKTFSEKATRMMYSNWARKFQPLEQTSLLELLS